MCETPDAIVSNEQMIVFERIDTLLTITINFFTILV